MNVLLRRKIPASLRAFNTRGERGMGGKVRKGEREGKVVEEKKKKRERSKKRKEKGKGTCYKPS